MKVFNFIYPSSHNHGSGKKTIWKLNTSSRTPFSTSMIMGRKNSLPLKNGFPKNLEALRQSAGFLPQELGPKKKILEEPSRPPIYPYHPHPPRDLRPCAGAIVANGKNTAVRGAFFASAFLHRGSGWIRGVVQRDGWNFGKKNGWNSGIFSKNQVGPKKNYFTCIKGGPLPAPWIHPRAFFKKNTIKDHDSFHTTLGKCWLPKCGALRLYVPRNLAASSSANPGTAETWLRLTSS